MNRLKKLGLVAAACLCVSVPATAVFESTVLTAEAHSGRTDARGGHRDNKNKSGLGSYHYHCGGYPAHLHKNGVCPYSSAASSSAGSGGSSSAGYGGGSSTGTAGQNGGNTGGQNGAGQTVTQEMMESYAAVFDADYYYNHYEDLQTAIGNDSLKLFSHFISCGMAEGRCGCENFDVNVYRQNNPDLDEAFGDDLPQYYHHYMNSGCREGRICH